MLRIEVAEDGHAPLPAIDVAATRAVIGSAVDATIRLPVEVADAVHVRIDGGQWIAVSAVGMRSAAGVTVAARPGAALAGAVDAEARTCAAGTSGPIGPGVVFVLGRYRVRVAPAPADAVASPVQRTESLARELARSWLGADAAPALEIERGPSPGARRPLPPPEGTLVIGRGDDATWVIIDEDLSRLHAEVTRGWSGTSIVDLGSKNGTRIDGLQITERATLHDGCRIELGRVVLRFADPAERHLRGERTAPHAPSARRVPSAVADHDRVARRPVPWPVVAAATIAITAIAGLVWVLAT